MPSFYKTRADVEEAVRAIRIAMERNPLITQAMVREMGIKGNFQRIRQLMDMARALGPLNFEPAESPSPSAGGLVDMDGLPDVNRVIVQVQPPAVPPSDWSQIKGLIKKVSRKGVAENASDLIAALASAARVIIDGGSLTAYTERTGTYRAVSDVERVNMLVSISKAMVDVEAVLIRSDRLRSETREVIEAAVEAALQDSRLDGRQKEALFLAFKVRLNEKLGEPVTAAA